MLAVLHVYHTSDTNNIAISRRCNMKEIKKIANNRIPLEKRIDLTVDKSGVNKGIIMKSFIKQLLKC